MKKRPHLGGTNKTHDHNIIDNIDFTDNIIDICVDKEGSFSTRIINF